MSAPIWPLPSAVSLSDLGQLGAQISGSAGQSKAVHVLADHPDWLVKLYKTPGGPDEAARLDGLITAPADLGPEQRDTLLASTSWPVARVFAPSATIVGCVIPRAPDHFRARLRVGPVADERFVEVDWLARHERSIAAAGLPAPTHKDRLAAVRTVMAVATLLERLDLVYSDWSYSNAFWSPAAKSVFVIDVDGCQVGKAPNVFQPNWHDPLTPVGTMADLYTDRFRLALLAARCLSGLRDAQAIHAIQDFGTVFGLPALPEVLLDMLLTDARDRRPQVRQVLGVLDGDPYVRPVPRLTRVPLPPAPVLAPAPSSAPGAQVPRVSTVAAAPMPNIKPVRAAPTQASPPKPTASPPQGRSRAGITIIAVIAALVLIGTFIVLGASTHKP